VELTNIPDPNNPEKVRETPRPHEISTGRLARRLEGARPGSESGSKRWFHKLRTGILGEPEKQEAIDERETSRLPASIPVTLWGMDRDGQAFREYTRTINVSKRGAKILTMYDFPVDTHIWLENTSAQRISIARIVRKEKPVDPKEATKICVRVLELLNPERIWGFKAPPKDWTRESERLSESDRLAYIYAKDRLVSPEILAERAVETAVPEAIIEEKAHEPAALLNGGEASDQVARVQEILESLCRTAGEQLDERLAAILKHAETAERTYETAASSINSIADRTVRRLEEAEEKTKESFSTSAKLFENRLTELLTRMHGLEGRSESLLRDFQGKLESALQEFLKRKSAETSDLQKVFSELGERAAGQLREQAEAAIDELKEEAEAIIRLLEERRQTQMANVTMALESAARVATELNAQDLARTSAELKERARLSTHEVITSISRASEDAMERLKARDEQIESRLSALIEAQEERMGELPSRVEDREKGQPQLRGKRHHRRMKPRRRSSQKAPRNS
jgi:hypothetical protein